MGTKQTTLNGKVTNNDKPIKTSRSNSRPGVIPKFKPWKLSGNKRKRNAHRYFLGNKNG